MNLVPQVFFFHFFPEEYLQGADVFVKWMPIMPLNRQCQNTGKNSQTRNQQMAWYFLYKPPDHLREEVLISLY